MAATQIRSHQIADNTISSIDIADGTILDIDIAENAGIKDTKLDTIQTSGKVANTATTASSNNTSNAIVSRDVNGDFAAGVITASLNGVSTSASKLHTARTIQLQGDVVGSISFDGSENVAITTNIVTNSTITSIDGGTASS